MGWVKALLDLMSRRSPSAADDADGDTPTVRESRVCVFCGRVPLTREHVFPRWLVQMINTLGQPRSATRVSDRGEHLHNIWQTSTIDLKARKVCRPCNSGWMSALEVAARPILEPLILSPGEATFSEEEAVTLGTWIAKTVLTASLLYDDVTNRIDSKYFAELYREQRPFTDSVVWIAGYDVGRYPVSSSMVPIEQVNGFVVTGNVGCLAYQVTAGDEMARGVVLPPQELVPYITQIWPLEMRPELTATLKPAWPQLGKLGRTKYAMNDDGLRNWSQIPNHSWDAE